MEYMKKNGIETGIHYKPVHKMSYFNNGLKLKETEKAGKEIVSLPTHPNLKQTEIEKIIHKVNTWININ